MGGDWSDDGIGRQNDELIGLTGTRMQSTQTGATLGQMMFQTPMHSFLQAFISFNFNLHLMIIEGPCEETHM